MKKAERERTASRRYRETHPETAKRGSREQSRKGGRNYEAKQAYNSTGLQGERHGVRVKHAKKWRQYKRIIAPLSQIHHEWIPGTADCRGIALVEADQHKHGIIKVIEVLDGEITLLREPHIWGERSNE